MNGPLAIGASNRGDLGTAPIYIIGGVIFFIGLAFILGFQTPDVGLVLIGVGLVLIGVREKPKMNFDRVKYTGPLGLVPILLGLLMFMHIL
jgi:hypothetical protein